MVRDNAFERPTDDARRVETDSQLQEHQAPREGAVHKFCVNRLPLHMGRFHKVPVSPKVSFEVVPARRTPRNGRIPHQHVGVIRVGNEVVHQVAIVMEGVAAGHCALELPVIALWGEQPVGKKTGLGELGINVRGVEGDETISATMAWFRG